MDGQTADSEGRIEEAEPVDVIHHGKENWRRESGMYNETVEVIADGNARRGTKAGLGSRLTRARARPEGPTTRAMELAGSLARAGRVRTGSGSASVGRPAAGGRRSAAQAP